jgi:lipopolysaccharide/colanic/teichoic acid biosynthesis glycosyltransferase
MSLVGPRPESVELIKSFKHEIEHYHARHVARPGLTGWAAVNGLRGDTDLSERIRCDLYYLENWNFFLDFQIMFLTFFRRKGAG